MINLCPYNHRMLNLMDRYCGRRLLGLLAAGFLSVSAYGSAPSAVAKDRNNEVVLRNLELLTLGNPRRNRTQLAKWKFPIRITVHGTFGLTERLFITDFVNDLHTIADVEMRVHFSPKVWGDVIVVFNDNRDHKQFTPIFAGVYQSKFGQEALKEALRSRGADYFSLTFSEAAKCVTVLIDRRTNAAVPGQPVFNIVSIPGTLDGVTLRRCIIEELAHAITFVSDAPIGDLKDSIFNSTVKGWQKVELTRNDRKVLAILLDKRIKAGMSLDELLEAAKGILEEGNR